jgi:hypothetical protein
MDILLHIDIFALWLKENILKEEEELWVYNILNNAHTKIVITEKISNYLLENHANTPKKKLFLKAALEELVLKNRIVRNIEESKKEEWNEYFVEVAQNYTGEGLFKIAKKRNDILNAVSDLTVLSEVQKPNIHWIRTYLAAYSTISVRYFDFKSTFEIVQFFKNFFSLAKISEVHIFDRYFNVEKHGNFRYLEENMTLIHYFSYDLPTRLTPERANNVLISLGANVKYYSTSERNLIHERKLIYHHYILETDEDFASIKIDRATWKIDITYHELLKTKILEKVSEFTLIP